MAEDSRSRRGPDPLQAWKQWYQSTVGAVSGALPGGEVDTFGFHRQWLADRQGSGERAQGGGGESPDGPVFLRQLTGATAESVRRTAEIAALMMRLVPHWGELAAELRRQMLTGGLPADPLDFSKRLYDATNGPLSAMIRDLLTDEAYLQFTRRLLENYVTVESVASGLSEDLFRRLQLSTSSDTTRLATMIIGLDEKVDRLEESVDDLGHSEAAPARVADVAQLREQVGRLEEKLDRLLTASAAPVDGDPRAGRGTGGGRRDTADGGAGREQHAANGAGDRKEGAR